ncbi:MAG: Fe-S cluster assembly protein SufD [Gammaproteobacteria bacterium]
MNTAGIEKIWRDRPADWLQPAREQGMAEFLDTGFPDRRSEAWKYTDAQPLADRSHTYLSAHPAPTPTAQLPAASSDSLPILFVNGRLAPGQTLPAAPGLHIASLNEAPPDRQAEILSRLASFPGRPREDLSALNAAFISDGLWIEVAADTVLEKPIEILLSSDGTQAAAQPRIMVSVGAHSQCRLIEHYSGTGAGLVNAVTDIQCDHDARLEWLKLQVESSDSLHVALQNLSLGRNSKASLIQIELGSQLSRNDLQANLAAPGAHVDVYGLFLADGQAHLDNRLEVQHQAPNTTSQETYRGIAAGRGRGIFNGKIIVQPGADGTDAKLSNRNLLLGAAAEIDTKPELEIYADDVKCAHGATTGQLDESALFYLRSRGIDASQARSMLVGAFAAEIVAQIPLERLRLQVETELSARLASDRGTDTP